ncbi:MAG: hypothetical protein Q8P32_00490 [Candidatus Komeilibacteria bacterium]|nr:hypothetical protein [Candidatus Komeilibacteria bacterium]
MSQFLQLSFWFDKYPLPFFALAMWVALGVLIAAVAFGAWSKWQSNKNGLDKLTKIVWQKLGSLFLSFGIVGLILMFFKQQRVPYLGMRFWLALWLVICLVWLAFILKFIFKEIPRIKEERKKQAEIKKYLP